MLEASSGLIVNSVHTGVSQLTAQQKKAPCLLWICRGDEGYGVASAIVNFSLCLEKQGWKIVVVGVSNGAFIKICEDLGWYTASLNAGDFPKGISGGILRRITLLAKSRRAAQEISHAALKLDLPSDLDITVVQTFNMLLLTPVSDLAKKYSALGIWRMPTHIRPRSPINYTRMFLQYRLWKSEVMAMGTSKFTTKSLGRGPALLATNAHGINTEKFTPNSVGNHTRSEFGIPEDAVVFIIVAQLYQNDAKGQLTFATALSTLGATHPKLHLLLLGGPSDGVLADKITNVIKSTNVNVHFTGPVNDVEKYYSLADIAVSARLSPEPFGLSVVEAMLMRKPVLAHATGGPAEIVDDNVTGWHSPTASVADFENVITRCLSDKAEWEQMGINARNVALKRYSAEAETRRWLKEVMKKTDRVS